MGGLLCNSGSCSPESNHITGQYNDVEQLDLTRDSHATVKFINTNTPERR